MWQALLDRGVLVRDVGLSGWLRVSAGTPAETDAFLDAMAQAPSCASSGPMAWRRWTSGGPRPSGRPSRRCWWSSTSTAPA